MLKRKTVLNRLHQISLIALSMAVLYGPMYGQAKESELTIKAPDGIAGLNLFVNIDSSSPNKSLEIQMENPSGKISNWIIEDTTEDKILIDGTKLQKSGEYTISTSKSSDTFVIKPGLLDQQKTEILTQNFSDEKAELKVKIRDSYGNALSNHMIGIEDAYGAKYAQNISSDQNGEAVFKIETNNQSAFTIRDISAGLTLAEEWTLARGGERIDEMIWEDGPIILSSEFGPVNGFRLDGIPNEVQSGKAQNLSLSAVDAEGNLVSDYIGTIRFSSSDNGAKLPGDYTFKAEDLGEHTFSLGVIFSQSGEHTLEVTDLGNTSLFGELTVNVSESAAGANDSSEGFELQSPLSGVYSKNQLTVVGIGEYGKDIVVFIDGVRTAHEDVNIDNSFEIDLEEFIDGEYEVLVQMVSLGEGNAGEEEILEIFASSEPQNITIDTNAPELKSVSSNPSQDFKTEEIVEITLLTESDLDEVELVFEGQLYAMAEDTNTKGKYEAEIMLPSEAGVYNLSAVLKDTLGNETNYRDIKTFNVSKKEELLPEIEKISGLFATPIEGGVNLSWETPQSDIPIAFYRVYYGPSVDAMYANVDTFDSATNLKISGLSGGAAHYFSVVAVDTSGNESEKSEPLKATPNANAAAPLKLPKEAEAWKISENTMPESTPDSGPKGTISLLILFSLCLTIAVRTDRIRAWIS